MCSIDGSAAGQQTGRMYNSLDKMTSDDARKTTTFAGIVNALTDYHRVLTDLLTYTLLVEGHRNSRDGGEGARAVEDNYKPALAGLTLLRETLQDASANTRASTGERYLHTFAISSLMSARSLLHSLKDGEQTRMRERAERRGQAATPVSPQLLDILGVS